MLKVHGFDSILHNLMGLVDGLDVHVVNFWCQIVHVFILFDFDLMVLVAVLSVFNLIFN
jgi:hypothetical protein